MCRLHSPPQDGQDGSAVGAAELHAAPFAQILAPLPLAVAGTPALTSTETWAMQSDAAARNAIRRKASAPDRFAPEAFRQRPGTIVGQVCQRPDTCQGEVVSRTSPPQSVRTLTESQTAACHAHPSGEQLFAFAYWMCLGDSIVKHGVT